MFCIPFPGSLYLSIFLPLQLWSDHGKKISKNRNLIEGSAVVVATAAIALLSSSCTMPTGAVAGAANWNPNYCCIWQLFLTQKCDQSFTQISHTLVWVFLISKRVNLSEMYQKKGAQSEENKYGELVIIDMSRELSCRNGRWQAWPSSNF